MAVLPLYDNSARIANGASTSGSASFTVGNNSDRVLIVLIGGQASTPDVPTYNGVSLTSIGSIISLGGAPASASAYYLVAPTIGSNTLAWSGTGSSFSVFAYSFYAVNQLTPIHTSATNRSDPATTTITTTSINCLPIAFAGQSSSGVTLSNIANNNLQDTGTTFIAGWDTVIASPGNHTSTSSSGHFPVTLQIALAPAAVSFTVSDSISSTETSIATRKAIMSTNDSITISESLSIHKGKYFLVTDILSFLDVISFNQKWNNLIKHGLSNIVNALLLQEDNFRLLTQDNNYLAIESFVLPSGQWNNGLKHSDVWTNSIKL